MELYEFIETSKPDHLTIKDLEDLKPGDILDVVCWDRNFEEYSIWESESDKVYDSETFFKVNRVKVIVQDKSEWDLVFGPNWIVRHPIHINVTGLNNRWTWVVIENNRVKVDKSLMDQEGQKIEGIPLEDFPKSTRVGWRGPMMLWSKLSEEKYKNVYWKELDDSDVSSVDN